MIWIFWLVGLLLSVTISIITIKKDRTLGYSYLTVIAAAFVLISNILTPRLMELNFFGYSVVLVTGSLIWPFIGQISDMINEVYGKRKTLIAFALAYLANLLFVIFIFMANHTSPVWSVQEEMFWSNYFIPSFRVFIASSISFVICQFLDVVVFSFLKEKWRNKESNSQMCNIVVFGTVRSAMSDMVNMIFDASVFAIIAFWGILPIDELGKLILGSLLIKVSLSVIDTPLFVMFRIGVKDVQRDK